MSRCQRECHRFKSDILLQQWRHMSLIAARLMNLSDDQQKFIQFVEGSFFPWYAQPTVEKNMFHAHTLMNRNDDRTPDTGIISSPHFDSAISIFKDFCLNTDTDYKTIFRAAINSTSYHDSETAEIHVDHKFEHKNFIFYITDVSKGSTFIYNQEQTEIEDVITPEKNKGVVWDGRPHTHGWCASNERRLVLIVTFI